MQLDDINSVIDYIISAFAETFGEEMVLINKKIVFENMRCFKIYYNYIPLEYSIVFENDRNLFVIDIFDKEKAKNTLYGISRFNNHLSDENIYTAVTKLKMILQENDFDFYVHKNEKLYKKRNGVYKRVKDLKELIKE